MKIFLRVMLGISLLTFVFGTPPAHAILGIRAARAALAARKAKQVASPASSTPEEAYAEEKAKFGPQAVREDEIAGQPKSSVLKAKEPA